MMKCHVCGCTDEQACPGGCGWALPGICTQCVDKTPFAGLAEDVVGLRLTGLEAFQLLQVLSLACDELGVTGYVESFAGSLAQRLAQTAPEILEMYPIAERASGLILPGR